MTFRQHIPPMVDTDAPPIAFAFETAAELLANPWIAQWKDDPGFTRYSVSLYSGEVSLLMVEYDRGEVGWWVLGYLRDGDPHALGLPFFHTPAAAVERIERAETA